MFETLQKLKGEQRPHKIPGIKDIYSFKVQSELC